MLTIKTFPVNMIEENTYVVSDESGDAVIIDCGALFPDELEAIGAYIADNGLRVVHVLNTHGHFDHIFGCQWAADTYGVLPQMHQDEKENYLAAVENMARFIRRDYHFDIPPIGKLLKDGDIIEWGNHRFQVIFTPGHTPGGICFYCEEEKVIFTGDSLFQGNIGRCDLPGGNLHDLVEALRSRLLTLPEDVTAYPGHGPTTTIAFERLHNPYL